jgi:hypothetical protein
MEIGLRLVGDARFADGSYKLTAITSQEGQVMVPAIVGGAPTNETTLYFDVPGQNIPPVRIVSIAHDAVARIKTYLSDNSGVILIGTDYAILDIDLLHTENQTGTLYSTKPGKDNPGSSTNLFGLCICVFKVNYGELTYDTSCRGQLAMWVIPENKAIASFTPATAGTTYFADGYKHGSQIYKIDGSTCNTISVSGGYYYTDSCVNNLADALGKKPPYPVGNNTFTNEPPIGVSAQYVR